MAFRDLRALRDAVKRIVSDDATGERLLIAWDHIEMRNHEIEPWQLMAVLMHAPYRIDKDYMQTATRFNAEGKIAGKPFKVVFEVHECPHGGSVVVPSGYDITPRR